MKNRRSASKCKPTMQPQPPPRRLPPLYPYLTHKLITISDPNMWDMMQKNGAQLEDSLTHQLITEKMGPHCYSLQTQ